MELNEIKQYDAEPGKTPRLFPYSEPGGKLTEYAYDSAGNRASETVTVNSSLVSAITYEVDNLNRLVRTTEETANETIVNDYFYDGAGNLTGRRPEVFSDSSGGEAVGVGMPGSGGLEPAIYGYNDKNQLVVAQAEGSEVANTFNFQGYRSSKTADGVTTHYLYEYDRIIKELDSQSNAVYNVYGLSLISREIDSDKVYYVYNGHGDVTAITSDSGVVIKSYYYDAFGVILAETGSFSNHFTYAGYYYDSSSGLYDCKSRFYDPVTARFLQEDTYNARPGDLLNCNRYVYCANNPLRYYDPSGHAAVSQDFLDSAWNAFMGGYMTYDGYVSYMNGVGAAPKGNPFAGGSSGGGSYDDSSAWDAMWGGYITYGEYYVNTLSNGGEPRPDPRSGISGGVYEPGDNIFRELENATQIFSLLSITQNENYAAGIAVGYLKDSGIIIGGSNNALHASPNNPLDMPFGNMEILQWLKTLLNSSGEKGIKLINPTTEQREAYERAISYLMTSPKAVELIEYIMNAPRIPLIFLDERDLNTGYDPRTGILYWNPFVGANIKIEKNGKPDYFQSPALALAHEMGHVWQHLEDKLPPLPKVGFWPDDVTLKIENQNLELWENPIAQDLGEYWRDEYSYGIWPEIMRTSTEWGIRKPWYENLRRPPSDWKYKYINENEWLP